tara:strand:- start:416 stop:931 length:516 start_codon:yes stop_codon:yes gene_type:complete
MWNKIKWILIGVSIVWMFYLNHQTNEQMKNRIDRIDIESSHHRTDIIGLKSDLSNFGITMTFHKNGIEMSNAIFKETLLSDVEHVLGMMESKLNMLDDNIKTFAVEYRMKDQMIRDEIFDIIATTDTLRAEGIETLKGRKNLQEQIDQLRLEFDELIQRLESNKKTKDIFQ